MAELRGRDHPRRPAPRPSARPTRRSRSARWPATTRARRSAPPPAPPRMTGPTRTGASFVESGPLAARRMVHQAGRDRLAAKLQPRGAAVRSARRHLRCLDAGQDRRPGPRRRAGFLDRLYTNTFSTLPVGRVRYGLMLREDGFVFDDGTVARLGDDHISMTTTTANAGKVMQHIEHALQWLWPDLDVQAVSVTEQWAQFAVAGPHSRAAAAASSSRPGHLQRRVPLHGGGGVTLCRRRAGRGSSASRSRANSPMRSACPPAMATHWRAP